VKSRVYYEGISKTRANARLTLVHNSTGTELVLLVRAYVLITDSTKTVASNIELILDVPYFVQYGTYFGFLPTYGTAGTVVVLVLTSLSTNEGRTFWSPRRVYVFLY